ncbi:MULTISPECIES: FG-GAP repeat domain-containing protein [Streptomyces]|uniref:VCBS repeat-containing protein n=1 Tax=Streptomyces cremeus TaxID=66881 RepID=A0ABV5P727_STRCM
MEFYVAKSTTRSRGRFLSRVAVAAITAALVGTTVGSAQAAPAPKPSPAEKAAAAAAPQQAPRQAAPKGTLRAAAVAQPQHALFGITTGDDAYIYGPNGTGGYGAREYVTPGYSFKFAAQSHNSDEPGGYSAGIWTWDYAGQLSFSGDAGTTELGGGWGVYNQILSPGDLAGAAGADLIARDGDGTLWLYLGYGDGRLTAKTKIGGGWGQYTQIAGLGDVSGDGRADIVARDGSGTLWLYEGNGDRNDPFASRVRIGGGWNMFNALVGAGDLDGDGLSDLIARGTDGSLWRYSGTGNPLSPFAARVQIGTSGWNAYRLMF